MDGFGDKIGLECRQLRIGRRSATGVSKAQTAAMKVNSQQSKAGYKDEPGRCKALPVISPQPPKRLSVDPVLLRRVGLRRLARAGGGVSLGFSSAEPPFVPPIAPPTQLFVGPDLRWLLCTGVCVFAVCPLGVPLSPWQAVAPLVPPTAHFVKLFAAETGAEHRSQSDEPSPMRVARLRQPPLIGRPDSPKAGRELCPHTAPPTPGCARPAAIF